MGRRVPRAARYGALLAPQLMAASRPAGPAPTMTTRHLGFSASEEKGPWRLDKFSMQFEATTAGETRGVKAG